MQATHQMSQVSDCNATPQPKKNVNFSSDFHHNKIPYINFKLLQYIQQSTTIIAEHKRMDR
jgi:hypothetical protein